MGARHFGEVDERSISLPLRPAALVIASPSAGASYERPGKVEGATVKPWLIRFERAGAVGEGSSKIRLDRRTKGAPLS